MDPLEDPREKALLDSWRTIMDAADEQEPHASADHYRESAALIVKLMHPETVKVIEILT